MNGLSGHGIYAYITNIILKLKMKNVCCVLQEGPLAPTFKAGPIFPFQLEMLQFMIWHPFNIINHLEEYARLVKCL